MEHYFFKVPQDKQVDLIIDTDAKNEADDQYAIAHALLSPKIRVLGVVATHFSKRRTLTSMTESYEECKKIVSLCKRDDVPIFKGNVEEIPSDDPAACELSEGAQFIIEAAAKSEKPLYIAFLGALTNLAAALIHNPSIGEKIHVVWVGGVADKDSGFCREANARNDLLAVNIVMDRCPLITHIPAEVYSTFQTSLAELQLKVKPCGKLGGYLFDQLNDFNYIVNRPWTMGESWCLGDNTAISYVLNNASACVETTSAFHVDSAFHMTKLEKEIQMISSLNVRYAMEDLFAKLRIFGNNEILDCTTASL